MWVILILSPFVYFPKSVFAPSLFTGIKIAKNSIELQRLRTTMTEEEIIFNVSHAWYDLLSSIQELENINDMLAKQDSLYQLIKRRVEENITREVDLNRIKVNLTNLYLRGENIRKTISQQKRYLQILIGMSVGDEFELDDATLRIFRGGQTCRSATFDSRF